jgi:hypothetical protein
MKKKIDYFSEAEANSKQFPTLWSLHENSIQTMDLFSTELDENQNLLPKDGTVLYYGHIMPLQEANFIYKIYWKPLPGKTTFHHLW